MSKEIDLLIDSLNQDAPTDRIKESEPFRVTEDKVMVALANLAFNSKKDTVREKALTSLARNFPHRLKNPTPEAQDNNIEITLVSATAIEDSPKLITDGN